MSVQPFVPQAIPFDINRQLIEFNGYKNTVRMLCETIRKGADGIIRDAMNKPSAVKQAAAARQAVLYAAIERIKACKSVDEVKGILQTEGLTFKYDKLVGGRKRKGKSRKGKSRKGKSRKNKTRRR